MGMIWLGNPASKTGTAVSLLPRVEMEILHYKFVYFGTILAAGLLAGLMPTLSGPGRRHER